MVFRPEKPNFALRFQSLAHRARGSIFSPSGERRRAEPVGPFLFNSDREPANLLGRILARMRLQVWLPLRLLWLQDRPDFIIAYDPFSSGVNGVLLKWFLRAKLVVEINGDHHEVRSGTRKVKRWLRRAAMWMTLSQADAIKVLNTSQERYFRERYPKTPVYRFMDFVAESYFRRLDTEEGDYFLSVGHPFHYKGVAELIEAFHLVVQRFPNMRLHLMGYCPEPELRAFREMAKGDPRIQFIPPGWIEDVGEQMRRCYAFVNASHFEAGGRVNMEAMACAKPVIATRTNGPSDYLQDGRNGLLCAIKDARDLAEKMERLAGDPDLARRLGLAGFDLLSREFTEQRYLERFLAMLEAVGERRHRRLSAPSAEPLRQA